MISVHDVGKGNNMQVKKRKMVPILDVLKKVKPNTWFVARSICEASAAPSIRRRLALYPEFQRREKPGNYVMVIFEYFITADDLDDLIDSISEDGRIHKPASDKQAITKGALSYKDILYNRFLGVKC